jgi:hypothetical protein
MTTYTKKLSIVFLLCLLSFIGVSQRNIEPKLVFSDTVSYSFSGEWQYLSTDIYLFNGDKFSALINELDFVRNEQAKKKKRRKTALSEEYLEYLFITARLKNVKFFGNNEVTYPLYNFQISKEKDAKYHTYVSDNIDNIRIIDNLPLYSASDFIDAEINVKAVTNNDRDQILGLVATQLKNISRIQTPSNAIMGIIAEFGNFIESNTKKKEYRFSSTIRLFEQKNFDSRLHSIKIYALLTGNSQRVVMDLGAMHALLDTAPNPEVNRQILSNLINYNKYPLIVVANYKSLYRMDQVTGDEINFAAIEKRKLKIETDYRAGLINAETYRQERDFINFITIFANFKNHLEVYNLNYRTGNTDAIAGSLFRITQYYRQLLKAHEEMLFKYRGNSTFSAIFRSEYESILGYAGQYLSDDHNLNNLKEMVKALVKLESESSVLSPREMEVTLSTLRFSDIFRHKFGDQSLEGQLLKLHIDRIEKDLLAQRFDPEIQKLNQQMASSQTRSASDRLRAMARQTSCETCRIAALEAIKEFAIKLEEFDRKIALTKRDSIATGLHPFLFEKLVMLETAKKNLAGLYPESTQSETYIYLSTKLAEAERDVKNLQDFLKIDMSSKERPLIETLNHRLASTQMQAQTTLNLICNLRPEVCQKNGTPPVTTSPEKRNKNAAQVFTLVDSVVRQANVFLSIFEFQLSIVEQNKVVAKENPILAKKFDKASTLLLRLKVAIDVLSNSVGLLPLENIAMLEKDVNLLVSDLSDVLAELDDA